MRPVIQNMRIFGGGGMLKIGKWLHTEALTTANFEC